MIRLLAIGLVMVILGISTVNASSGGIFDRYTNASNCSACHTASTYNYTASVIGSTVVAPNDIAEYTFSLDKASGSSANAAGFNLHGSSGTLSSGTNSKKDPGDNQLTHVGPDSSGAFQWQFDWQAPSVAGLVTLSFCGLPVNHTGSSSGDGSVDCGTFTIDVNEPPTAVNDTATVNENSSNNTVNVLNNDDAGGVGDTRKIIGVCSTATNNTLCNASTYNGSTGLVSVDGTGINNTVLVTPDANQTSNFTFKYKMENSAGQTDTATVTISVSATPPQANDDSIQVPENSDSIAIDVLTNDLPQGSDKTIVGICSVGTSDQNCNNTSYSNSLGDSAIFPNDVTPNNVIRFEPIQDGTFQLRYKMSPSGSNATDTAILTVVITDVTVVDDPPVFTSVPPTEATEGIRYFYDSDALDPEGETLAYSLMKAPSGTLIDTKDGRIAWVPDDGAPSTAGFIIRATEIGVGGQFVEQSFNVSLTRVNDAPVITSTAPSLGLENEAYTYQVTVFDPDDSINGISFGLLNEPQGMTIDNQGLLTWLPGDTSAGEYTFKVGAQDGGEDGAKPAIEIVTLTIEENSVVEPEQDSLCFPVVTASGAAAIICL